ncbi:MAG: tyrosine-type recombinase/integrase [Colwellia sp.]|nr:tyrosine-type recombinase/integrase [Colwellia sp.]
MNEVNAVTNKAQLEMIPVLLEKHYGQQSADIWSFGVQVALRISDLLSIEMTDIAGDILKITESKTGKVQDIKLNFKAMEILNRVKTDYPNSVYLFQSRTSNRVKGKVKALGRSTISASFKAIGEMIGLAIGTHSMRKTRGYHVYQATKDIAFVMHMLNHSSAAVTLRYIGITREDQHQSYLDIVL